MHSTNFFEYDSYNRTLNWVNNLPNFTKEVSEKKESVSEDNKVYEVVPTNKEQKRLLEELADETQINIWKDTFKPTSLNVMIPGNIQEVFEKVLTEQRLYFKLIIQDIQSLVTLERQHNKSVPSLVEGQISFQKYHRYSEIQDYLNYLSTNYSKIVEFGHYGLSYEKRNLSYIRISTGGSHHKPIIFIDAGIHAREWIAPAQALYILHQLVENVENRYLINKVDWIIVPLANPDGYEYSHVKDRFWRKTRSRGKRFKGVDPNRNFDFKWNKIGTSDNEKSGVYCGPYPFSEPETAGLSQIIIKHSSHIKLYLTIHSCEKCIIYPYGFTKRLPQNVVQLHNLAIEVQQEIIRVNDNKYLVGNSPTILKPSSGSSRDWVHGVVGIGLAYTLELPRGGVRGFDLPAKDIIGVVTEVFKGIKIFHKYIETEYG